MPTLNVQVIRFVDNHFPGFVECEFVDVKGQPHRFISPRQCRRHKMRPGIYSSIRPFLLRLIDLFLLPHPLLRDASNSRWV